MNNVEELPSDTDDEDYAPTSGEESGQEQESDASVVTDDEGNEDKEGERKAKTNKRKKRSKAVSRKRKKRGVHYDEEVNNDEPKIDFMLTETELAAKEKKKADDLWAMFTSDLPSANSDKSEIPKTSTNVKQSTVSADNGQSSSKKFAQNKEVTTESQIVEFAGEKISISNDGIFNLSESSNSKLLTQSTVDRLNLKSQSTPTLESKASITPGAKKGGLSGVLSKITGPKKISTLEKSRLDWNSFKRGEGLEEELQTHNRGKDGFLERQAFLGRVDLRQFEIEKDIRSTHRTPR